MEKTSKNKKRKPYRFLRILAKSMLSIVLLLVLLILFIRSSWGQQLIINKATSYVTDKTDTNVALEKFYLTFDGGLLIEGLFLDDLNGDTLVYSKSLEANIALWPLITGESIGVDAINWNGFRANVHREDRINGYNFQFLVDAFATEEPTIPEPVDTTTSNNKIVLGGISLNDFNIDFNDKLLGIESKVVLGSIQLDVDEIDFEGMNFHTSLFQVEKSAIKLHQTPTSETSISTENNTEEESNLPLPKLTVDAIQFNNLALDYASQADSLSAQLYLTKFLLEIPNINLNTNEFTIGELSLEESKIAVQNGKQEKAAVVNETSDTTAVTQTFEWPDFDVKLAKINFQENEITYQVGSAKPEKGSFNPEAIHINKFTLDVADVYLKEQATGLQVNQFGFSEASGIKLNTLGFGLSVTNNTCHINHLKLDLNGNELNADVNIGYESVTNMIAAPEKAQIDLELSHYKLNIKEFLELQSSLKEQESIVSLSEKELYGQVNINGNLAELNIPNFTMNWGENTKVFSKGSIENPSDPTKLKFDFETIQFESIRKDLLTFAEEDSLGIRLPNTVQLNINTSGTLEDLYANLALKTSQGNVYVKTNYTTIDRIAYALSLDVDNYMLGALLKDEQIGALNLDINSKGSGESINQLDADLHLHLNALKFNDYTIKGFNLNGNLADGKGHIKSAYKDKNINLVMDAMVLLDSIAPQANLKIDLIGADLNALGLSDNDLRTGLKLNLNYEGKTDGFDVDAKIDDGIFVFNNKSYLLGDFQSYVHIRKDSTAVGLHNKMLDLELKSNADPSIFANALQEHLGKHFSNTIQNSVDRNPVNLSLDGELRFDPLLKEVFLVDMEEMKTIKLAVDFNERADLFNAKINAPLINYAGNRIDSLVFDINSNKDILAFNVGFDGIDAGLISIERTLLSGNQKGNTTKFSFLSYDDDEKLIQLTSSLKTTDDGVRFHIIPDSLTLNKMPWQIPVNNAIVYTKDKLVFNDFKIQRNKQSVEITDQLSKQEDSHIALVYNNFNLNKIFSYLNPDKQFIEGIIDGEFIVERPFSDTGILADLSISELKLMDVAFGELNLDAKSTGDAQYTMALSTKEGAIDIDLTGVYASNVDAATLDLNLAISKFEMAAMESFSQGELSNTSGKIEGDFSISGPTSALAYEGELRFKDTQFKVAKLNAPFALQDEAVTINNGGINLKDFTLRDKNNNTLIIAGNIATENPSNPDFDLSIHVNDFQLLDATEKDNDFVYGTAIFDVESKLTGNLNLPKLNIKAEVNAATDFTYVMPSASVNIEERDGVVSFVNRKNPEAILTRTEEETVSITGIDVDASIKVVDGAKVNILIDKETGDNFEVYGAGDLQFRMNPNGKMNLVGFYEVSGGHYEMNLYNIVDRKFELVKGSRISWSGDVLDAKLDIKTLYNVETSAASLMAAQTSGADPSVKSKFRQVLPFEVYLNVNGAMLQPLISFNLDMPEDEQGAIGGQVYARIQQLNQSETELNKQVFALLVLNSFYPDPESDGSNGGAASIARENINDALSDQLNMFSDKLLGDTGVELDFGLDSYTDYQSQSPTERTQLDIAAQKKLLDDRLIVRVGSEVDLQGSNPNGEATPIIGNVSLEYILTEDGRYRLKGFRRNQFDNVIDGQTIASGIGLIFTQEFNKFSELKDAILLKKKLKKEQALKEKETTNNR